MGKPIDTRLPTAKSYVTGFVLASLLTATPFALAATGVLRVPNPLAVIFLTGIVQALVHLRYFLHLSFSPGKDWFLVAILFTLLIIAIMAGGTFWILSDLNAHMMPP